jgi:hypothetical protein
MRRHRHRYRQLAMVALFALSLLWASVVAPGPVALAQEGGDTTYNEPLLLTLAPGQTVTRTFAVLAGDSFQLRLTRLADYAFSAVLLDPDQNPLSLSPSADGNVLVEIAAARGGLYTLVLQATAGSGDMLLLVSSDAVKPELLAPGETIVEVGTGPLRYELGPQPGPMTLLVEELVLPDLPALGLPDFALSQADSGEAVLALAPARLLSLSLVLPAQTGFLLALQPGEAIQQVRIVWNAAPQYALDAGDLAAPTAVQPVGQPTSVPAAGTLCVVYVVSPVNVRPGPGVAYAPQAVAPAGATLPATGHNGDYSWYQVAYNGQLGWVSLGIAATQAQGNCSALPVASYAPPTGAAHTATPIYTPTTSYTLTSTVTPYVASLTPTVTYTPGGPTLTYTYTPPPPTATYTPSYTPPAPTATYTHTPSPSPSATHTATVPAPVAPPDANFNSPLNIPLDSTVSSTDFVSYPNGDTEDRVRWDITGMNPNSALSGGRARLIISASCFGTGTQHIQFFVGGQTRSCGQTLVDQEVTYDSRTGQVTITAVGGAATYVQWVLTGSATRLN